jgi:hypothetical protein
VDASGVWVANHRFTVNGSFPLYAATTGDLTNYAGRSPLVQAAIR